MADGGRPIARRLLHVYSTFAVGGPQMRFAAIANHFGRRWQHGIIAMNGDTACRERLDPELEVSFPMLDIRKGDTFGNIRRFRAFLRDWQPDTLVTSNWGSIEWAMASLGSGVRHLHMEDGFGPEERAAQIPRRVWTRRIFLRGRTVTVPSLVLRRIAVEQWKLPERRVRYVPNGIDLARFHPEPAEDRIPVVGTVAALRGEKNIGRLLDAFAMATADRAGRLVIVGDGSERAALEAQAGRLGIAEKVEFAGHHGDTAPFYRRFDIFALSSDTEQMPISVLEAMGSGLPLAATDVGDVGSMVAAENRGFVGALTSEALAGSLSRLLADRELRRSLGAANRSKAERDYADSAMFAAWAALYDDPR